MPETPVCPSCATPLVVASDAGQVRASCPNCHAQFRLPEPGAPGPARWSANTSTRSLMYRRRGTGSKSTQLAIGGGVALVVTALLAVAAMSLLSDQPNQRTNAKSSVARKSNSNENSRSTKRSIASASDQRSPPGPTVGAPTQPDVVRDGHDDSSDVRPPRSSSADKTQPQGSADPATLANALLAPERQMALEAKDPTSKSAGGGLPQDYETKPAASAGKDRSVEDESPELTPAERRRLIETNRLKRLIRKQFTSQPRTNERTHGQVDDYFVVAKYEMPLITRAADIRFETTREVDPSVELVADYLLTTPTSTLRDFQVVARFSSEDAATQGIQSIRQQYDRAKEYQAQFLAFLQAQQRFQAQTIRRC